MQDSRMFSISQSDGPQQLDVLLLYKDWNASEVHTASSAASAKTLNKICTKVSKHNTHSSEVSWGQIHKRSYDNLTTILDLGYIVSQLANSKSTYDNFMI